MKTSLFAAALLFVVAAAASAQMVESKATASNGVVIDVSKDEFAGRAEYGSPFGDLQGSTNQRGKFLVAKVISAKSPARISVQGFVSYSGQWHFYDSAILKGGETVEFINTKRDVISCRYGCSYSESFIVFPTAAQIAKYGENGVLPIQVRGRSSGNTLLLNVPLTSITAINEIAK